MQQANEEWLRGVKQIAAYLGVGPRTVERWIADRALALPVLRMGGRWVAHTGSLREWMRERAAA